MLDLLTKHESHIRNVPVVTLSILFHDIIYDPKSRDNGIFISVLFYDYSIFKAFFIVEEKSAELFLKFAEEFNKSIQQEQQNAPVSQDDIRLVEKYILMTKSHKIDDDTLMHDNDAKLFMDFDLDVLSWTPQQYDEYSKQIRQEYSFVEKEAYRSGRTQVLKQLSSGSSIYFSDLWGKEAGSFVWFYFIFISKLTQWTKTLELEQIWREKSLI